MAETDRIEVLTAAKLWPPMMESLRGAFTVHDRIHQGGDAAAFAAAAPRIRAIAASGESKVPRELIAQLPKLELISVFGVGYDGVDVAAARERGIAVTHTPNVLNDEVADLAIALVLAHRVGWGAAYAACAAFALPAMLVGVFMGEPARHREPARAPGVAQALIAYFSPLAEFLRRQGALVVLLFVLIHKIGDTLANLTLRLLFQELGFTNDEVAFYDVGIGFVALLVVLFVFYAASGAFDVAINAGALGIERATGRHLLSAFHGAFSGGGMVGALAAGRAAGRTNAGAGSGRTAAG